MLISQEIKSDGIPEVVLKQIRDICIVHEDSEYVVMAVPVAKTTLQNNLALMAALSAWAGIPPTLAAAV